MNGRFPVVDRRLRLAAHDLALDKLLAKESIRYYLKTSFGPWYVHGVLRRTPLSELGWAIGKKVLQQLRAYGRGALQLVRGSLANLGKTG